jgi:hypothetical protein
VKKEGQTTFCMCVNIFLHFVLHLQTFSLPLLTVVISVFSFFVNVPKFHSEYHLALNSGTVVTFLNVI